MEPNARTATQIRDGMLETRQKATGERPIIFFNKNDVAALLYDYTF